MTSNPDVALASVSAVSLIPLILRPSPIAAVARLRRQPGREKGAADDSRPQAVEGMVVPNAPGRSLPDADLRGGPQGRSGSLPGRSVVVDRIGQRIHLRPQGLVHGHDPARRPVPVADPAPWSRWQAGSIGTNRPWKLPVVRRAVGCGCRLTCTWVLTTFSRRQAQLAALRNGRLNRLSDLLRVAFKGRFIDSLDHPVFNACGVKHDATSLDTFREVWLVDFEFNALAGERPTPICMVARELRTGRTLTALAG